MIRSALLFAGLSLPCTAFAVQVSGKVGLQWQAYPDKGQYSGQQYQSNLSANIGPEFYWQWRDGNSSLLVKPYYRIDEHDDERSRGDIREFLWMHTHDNIEIKAGISKVFWGVTEFQHLVDVINQTDSVDSFDGEEKLGQPMVNLSLVNDWGIVDAFVLPGFRERSFAGKHGRLRPGMVIDDDNARYQSDDKDQHVDYALRWSHSVDVFDLGAYWFNGTNREPVFEVNGDKLTPYYEQMTQFGVDLQATIDAWLWKAEAIYRDAKEHNFSALQAGFEYTLYGIQDSDMDLGLLTEYGWNERGKHSDSVAQNDIYAGARLTLNDAASSDLLIGGGYDPDYHSKSLLVEASRRIGESWKLSLDMRVFDGKKAADPITAIRKDDRFQLTLERYF
ncbi:hypothetical protein [Bacterioplanoides sp.]|uniref:hypothetical protein n=1 Tax=Bacterioplanoides sp. TaxID=2066072 RepID=UPI003B5C5E92